MTMLFFVRLDYEATGRIPWSRRRANAEQLEVMLPLLWRVDSCQWSAACLNFTLELDSKIGMHLQSVLMTPSGKKRR